MSVVSQNIGNTAEADDVLALVREDLRAFAGYRSARTEKVAGSVWLNANESAWSNRADAEGVLQRYPQPQPEALRARLAEVYGVAAAQILIGRGSDEAIDLIIRALCRAERDPVVISTPVFGMYAVCARLQAAPIIDVPLLDGDTGFRTDLDAVREAALRNAAKVVFVCSPGNPGGELVPLSGIEALATALRGHSLVVVDEAYIEFADTPSATTMISRHPNILVLRTLSKLHALAGARIGCAIADPALIEVLRRCQAPYPVPAPCAALALAALQPDAMRDAEVHVATIRGERERVFTGLRALPGVRRVYASAGNFILARFDNAERCYRALLDAGVVVRDMRMTPGLEDALRITIGTPNENEAVFAALCGLDNAENAA
jgi:histidinol-phosphate aminotransferase